LLAEHFGFTRDLLGLTRTPLLFGQVSLNASIELAEELHARLGWAADEHHQQKTALASARRCAFSPPPLPSPLHALSIYISLYMCIYVYMYNVWIYICILVIRGSGGPPANTTSRRRPWLQRVGERSFITLCLYIYISLSLSIYISIYKYTYIFTYKYINTCI